MNVKSVSSNSFKGIDVSGVTQYYKPMVRNNFNELERLAKGYDVKISSKCVKDSNNKYLNAILIESKPFNEIKTSKEALEVKTLYIPGRSIMNFVDSVKANLSTLKENIKKFI